MLAKIKKTLKYLALLALVAILSVTGFYFLVKNNVFGSVFTTEDLQAYKNETASIIKSEDDVIIGKFFNKNRTNAKFEDLPKHLINALVATEDARFFEHSGVDSRSMFRVFIKSILLGNKRSGGGSTISQQLAKNMTGRSEFGFMSMPVNKTKEIIIAQRIEGIYSKENILTLYLNTVSFGENIFGIETAALRYFNKKTSDLTVEESATLIGILKANTYYNPHINPENALKRRNVVLKQMATYNYLSSVQIDSLTQLPLQLNYNNLKSNNKSGHFIAFVEKETKTILDSINTSNKTDYNVLKDGLIITTTLNNEMQNYANQSFYEHLSKMQDKFDANYNQSRSQKNSVKKLVDKQLKQLKIHPDSAKIKRRQSVFNWNENTIDSISKIDSLTLENKILHAGLMAISPKTGAIKTYIGGINHQRYAYDQVFAKRQLASTFKPILYTTAIESGKLPCDYLDNDEITLSDYKGWSPTNADNSVGGKYSLQGALLNSKNIPTVNLYLNTSFTQLDTIWNRLNFSSKLENNPSLALGTATASIYEVARAYTTFANYGKIATPYAISKIETVDGTIIYEHKTQEPKLILNEKTAVYINKILQNAINRGTGTSLRNTYSVKMPLAGKTGTSQDYTDAWFVGYNPDLVMVSRVGCNSPTVHFTNGSGSGSSLALPLVAKTLKALENNPELKRRYSSNFLELSENDALLLACDDFKEDSGFDKVLDFFSSKEKSFEKQQERAQRKAERQKRREKRRKD
jgi:penicillin-binding protein 1A